MPKLAARDRRTSPAQEDYLKALHGLSRAGGRVPTSALAEELGVSSPSVSEMLSKLADQKLITHDPYHGASLTQSGSAIAVEIVRHHRLLETYLVKALGYTWDEVHEDADRLEHAISEKLEQRMWEALGRPTRDPHGHPIPAPDGTLQTTSAMPLHQVTGTDEVRVSRISDHDPEMLRAIERIGLLPGVKLRVVEISQWEGPIMVEVGGERRAVPLGLARAISVEVGNG